MRFDLVSIFPHYFDALQLSLLGKAQQTGQLEIHAHDLRQWAEGKHRSVDGSPAGGGAGMVMRADVWGKALDHLIEDSVRELPQQRGQSLVILAIPTPSGVPFTQRMAERFVKADQIIVACGRYEGIDSRIAEHFRDKYSETNEDAGLTVEVVEFSLGDYVLNGGEAAALILVEAVGRLVEGVVGNPHSLVEESHSSEGLLEYPVFTQPKVWEELSIPQVLLSGDHAKIARWRRDRALEKTAALRPDLLLHLDTAQLDARDKQALAQSGWLLSPILQPVTFRIGQPSDVQSLSELAARTFPDACPPDLSPESIQEFIEDNLSVDSFAQYLSDEDYLVVVAEAGTPDSIGLAAYTLVARSVPELQGGNFVPEGSAYLSKCYADENFRGSGITAGLLSTTVDFIRDRWDSPAVTLGTNYRNKRAAKFYRRNGFRKVGRRYFQVGGVDNLDDVFVLKLTD